MVAPVETVLHRVAGRIGPLLPPGTRALVACSGGPDSSVLLDVLVQLQSRADLSLEVAHVDHGQVPTSGRAAAFVARRCRRLGLPVHVLRLDPGLYPVGSSEDLLRRGRYAALEAVARSQGCGRIATGHTGSDQAETVLLRLLRGTSIAGLAGIPADRGGWIVRPLLDVSRSEVFAYLRARRLHWFDDPTNRSLCHRRNRVRHALLPALEKFNPRIEAALRRLAAAAARDERALQAIAAGLPIRSEGCFAEVELDALRDMPAGVQVRVILALARRLCGPAANFELEHLERLLARLAGAEQRFRLGLEAGFSAEAEQGRFRLHLRSPGVEPFEVAIDGPGEFTVAGRAITARWVEHFDPAAASADRTYYAGIDFPLVCRSARPGDVLSTASGTRKVARVLIDAKVPRHLRPSVPLLVFDGHVLWIVGVRRSDRALVGSRGDRVLEIAHRAGVGGAP